jgi:hypothetical protein
MERMMLRANGASKCSSETADCSGSVTAMLPTTPSTLCSSTRAASQGGILVCCSSNQQQQPAAGEVVVGGVAEVVVAGGMAEAVAGAYHEIWVCKPSLCGVVGAAEGAGAAVLAAVVYSMCSSRPES